MKKRDYQEKEIRKIHYNTKWNYLFVSLSALLIAGLVCMMYSYLQQEQRTKAHWEEVKLQVDAQRKLEEQAAQEAAEQAAAEEAVRRIELEKVDSFYQKLKDGFDVNILVLGDTIATSYGMNNAEYNWMNTIEAYLEQMYRVEVSVTNLALEESSVYAGYTNLMMLDDEVEYDLAIICYGEKDSADSIDIFYEGLIRAIRAKYVKCSILPVIEATQLEYDEKTQRIQTLAEHYNLPVVDVIEAFASGEYAKVEELTDDGIHPNDTGHQLYAYIIVQVIDAEVKEYVGYDDSQIEPLSEFASYFDTFTWYSVENFTREAETYTYTATGQDISNVILGLDFDYVVGENSCEIIVDGETLGMIEKHLADGEEGRQIISIGILDSLQSELVIRFATPQQADGFRGIYLNGLN